MIFTYFIKSNFFNLFPCCMPSIAGISARVQSLQCFRKSLQNVLLPHSRDLGTASMDDGPAPSSAPGKALFPSERLGKPSKLCHQELHLLGLTSPHLPLALLHLPLAFPAPSAAGEPCSVSSWP